MLLLVKMGDNTHKKVFIRNQVFYEVDNQNKKLEKVSSNSIKRVYWYAEKQMKEFPVKDFITLAEENDYWNA